MHLFLPSAALSLYVGIALQLPAVIARWVPADASISAARLLNARVSSADPGNVQPQMNDLFQYLSKVADSKVKARPGTAQAVANTLDTSIKTMNKVLRPKPTDKTMLRILFIEYAGSGGDVGKSMTYPTALKDRSVFNPNMRVFNRVISYIRSKIETQPIIEMKLAVDCNYITYMTTKIRQAWASDIQQCSVAGGTETDNQNQFKSVVDTYLTDFQPHIVIQGNAISGIYEKQTAGFWDDFHKQMDAMVTADEIVRLNIRADFKQVAEVEKKLTQYPLKPTDLVLVGQSVDFLPGLPSETKQTRIGRPQVIGMAAMSPQLKAWLDKSKYVIYLGLGGRQRSHELPIGSPNAALNQFLQELLKKKEYDDL
jgi:hypothetical protein